MVRVRTQSLQRVAVQPARPVYQSPDVPSGAFDRGGAGLIEAGKQIGGFGDKLTELSKQIQKDDNDAEVKQKDNQIADAIRTTLYGDGETNKGYLGSERSVAVDGYGETTDSLTSTIQKIVESSSNSSVRRRVGEMGVARGNRAADRMVIHAGAERKKHLDSVGVAREAQAASDAATAWGDDGITNRSLSIVEAEVEDEGERHSRSREEVEIIKKKKQSVVLKGAFDAAIANENLPVAERIMALHGDKLEGTVKAEMEKQLRTEGISVRAQTIADSARSLYPTDYEAQREYVKKVLDGKAEDKALQNLDEALARARGDERQRRLEEGDKRKTETQARADLNHMHKLDTRARGEALRKSLGAKGEFLYDPKATTPRTVAQFRKDNPTEFKILSDNGEIEKFQKEARNIQLGQLYSPTSDGKTYGDFAKLGIAEQAGFDLVSIRASSTLSEYNRMISLQASAQRKMKGLTEDKSSYKAGTAAIIRVAQLPSPAKRTAKDLNMLAAAEKAMGVWITEVLQSGRKPTQPEIDLAASKIAVQIVSDPWGFSLGVLGDDFDEFKGLAIRKGQMSEAQRANATVPFNKIPPPINIQIDAWLAKRKIESISEDTREELAGAYAMGDGPRIKKLLKDAAD